MNVKGTALKSTRDFVKTTYPEKYKAWLDSMPAKSQELYKNTINATEWFPADIAYYNPVDHIAKMFFGGNNQKCGDAIGQFSAELALKGYYKVFLLIASPKYLVQRASKIVSTFYNPSKAEAFEISGKSAGLRILECEGLNEAFEYRIGGWCKKALELSNCKGINYKINKAMSKGDDMTEIVFSWD